MRTKPPVSRVEVCDDHARVWLFRGGSDVEVGFVAVSLADVPRVEGVRWNMNSSGYAFGICAS